MDTLQIQEITDALQSIARSLGTLSMAVENHGGLTDPHHALNIFSEAPGIVRALAEIQNEIGTFPVQEK